MIIISNPPTPHILTSETQQAAASNTATTAGAIFFQGVVLYGAIVLSQLRCNFAAVIPGNVDMGIYDATGPNLGPGNLLAHTGAIVATANIFTQPLQGGNILLNPGKYWMAFLSTAADTVSTKNTQASTLAANYRSVGIAFTVLPATAPTLQATVGCTLVDGLIAGGYS